MNGRTCQLCGKPLSRIRVGTGGDFCSREHRNQYRLRCGMDRLLEANRMASLMRRRENLKPLAGLRPGAAEDAKRRGYLEPESWKTRPAGIAGAVPRIAPRLETRMRGVSRFAGPRPRFSPPGRPRVESRPAVPPRRRPLLLPARDVRRPVSALGAGAALPPHCIRITEGNCRSYGVMLRKLSRPLLAAPRARAAAPANANYSAPARRALPCAQKGTDLRICAAAGFRIPARTLRGLRLDSRALAAMTWPQAKSLELPEAGAPDSYRWYGMNLPIAEAKLPASRSFATATASPGLVPVPVAVAQPAVSYRIGQAPFELHDPLWFRGPAGQEDE